MYLRERKRTRTIEQLLSFKFNEVNDFVRPLMSSSLICETKIHKYVYAVLKKLERVYTVGMLRHNVGILKVYPFCGNSKSENVNDCGAEMTKRSYGDLNTHEKKNR